MANYSYPTSGLTSGVSAGALANWYALNGLLDRFDTTVVSGSPTTGDALTWNGTGIVFGTVSGAATAVSINAQTGTTYTLVLGDAGKLVTLTNVAAVTLTVPPNSSVAYPTGTFLSLAQLGAGQVTVAEGSGVTVTATPGKKLVDLGSVADLVKTGTNTWLLSGRLTA